MLIVVLLIAVACLIFVFCHPKEFSFEIPLRTHTPFRDYIQQIASKYNDVKYTAYFAMVSPLLFFEITKIPPELKRAGKSDELLFKITYNYFKILMNYAESKGYPVETIKLIEIFRSFTYQYAAKVYKTDAEEIVKKHLSSNMNGDIDAILDITYKYLNTYSLQNLSYAFDIEAEVKIWASLFLPRAYEAVDQFAGRSARYVRTIMRG